MELVAGKLPAWAADRRNGYGQRRTQAENDAAVSDLQAAGGDTLAPVGQLVEHPCAVFVDQLFNVADPCPCWRTNAQAAMVDGEADEDLFR